VSKEFFNARAAAWDDYSAEKDTAKLEAMAARLDIKPGSTVLDVGTGTGVFVPYLLQKIGRDGALACLDFAEEMIKSARAKNFRGNVSFVCTAIEDNGLPAGSFDAVVCYSVFPHFDDRKKVLQEIYRVLKKEGKLFICHTSGRRNINEIHRRIPEVSGHLLPENQDMLKMLTEAGFTGISIEDEQHAYLARACKPG